jgi:hypothetical protein
MTSITPGGGGANTSGAAGTASGPIPTFVAIAVLIAFCILIIFLLKHLELEQQKWDRAVYILTAVEAIAFAAAGFLFGREVHRASAAENRAKKAEKKADENATAAEKGRSLARIVLAKQGATPQRQEEYKAFIGESKAVVGSADLHELALLARDVLGE